MDSGILVFVAFLVIGLLVVLMLAISNDHKPPHSESLSETQDATSQFPPSEPPQAFREALERHAENPEDEEIKRKFLLCAMEYYFYASENNAGLFKLRERVERKHDSYRDILSLLQKYPHIPKLHTMALEFGRLSYGISRPNQVLTIYDENALANDIRAAAGAAQAHSEPQKQTTLPKDSIKSPAERLKALTELRDGGLITPEEYESKRAAILNEL